MGATRAKPKPTEKKKSNPSEALSKTKPAEKKKSNRSEAGGKKKPAETKKRPRSAAANKRQQQPGRHKPSGGVSTLVKNKLRSPGYKILAWRTKSGELVSVAVAIAEEKMSCWRASMRYGIYACHPWPSFSRIVRRMAAKEAMQNKKLAASEKRAQKVFAAHGLAHARRAKAYETRAEQLNQAVH